MYSNITHEDLFRFSHIRPVVSNNTKAKLRQTGAFYNQLAKADWKNRMTLADQKLASVRTNSDILSRLKALGAVQETKDALSDELYNKPLSTFVRSVDSTVDPKKVLTDEGLLSDYLLAILYATSPSEDLDIEELTQLYSFYYLLGHRALFATSTITLQDYLNAGVINAIIDIVNSVINHVPNGRIDLVGITDLMVVKRHVLRYEPSEVGYIENVMAKESRSRDHRSLDRLELSTSTESNVTTEKQKEYETQERFELSQEIGKTIATDRRFGAELSVSGKYGPTVEFSTKLNASSQTSTSSTSKSAERFAKDVVNRSMERLTESIKEKRSQKIIREVEEINRHAFENDSEKHITGVYQFVDKVYRSQVFNYGKRAMFDLMIPEPASYLWHLMNGNQSDPGKVGEPVPPPEFNISPDDIHDFRDNGSPETHYMTLAATFQASGIDAPPSRRVSVSENYENAKTEKPESERGQPRVSRSIGIEIPENYSPKRVIISGTALTDAIAVATDVVYAYKFTRGVWNVESPTVESEKLSKGNWNVVFGSAQFNVSDSEISGNRKLFVSFVSWETANYSLNFIVECERTDQVLDAWKLDTYNKLLDGHRSLQIDYERKLAESKQEQALQGNGTIEALGLPPSQKKQIILTELKKHAISIFTQQWYKDFEAYDNPERPREFNIRKAEILGSFTRFFEQAFEWNQIQYALYPYFWSDNDQWSQRFLKTDNDYYYQQFLQSGAARVVLAVRPGFEAAILHYLETGKIWNGRSNPPRIGRPEYLAIVDEIKDQDGVADKPEPIGKPWEVKTPTTLVKLNIDGVLPRWKQTDESDWSWKLISEED